VYCIRVNGLELQTKETGTEKQLKGVKSFSGKSLRVSGWDGHLRAKARHDCYVEECLLCGWHPYSTENGKHVLSFRLQNAYNS
jgi:hypothetical protein